MLSHYKYAKIDTGKQKRHGKRAPGMRTVLERPKSQVLYHGGARAGAPRAPHGATTARKVHPETRMRSNTMQILIITKKKSNVTA